MWLKLREQQESAFVRQWLRKDGKFNVDRNSLSLLKRSFIDVCAWLNYKSSTKLKK